MAGLTYEELKEVEIFKGLTEKQQRFVKEYIANGYELVPAMRIAYPCKNDHVAHIMSYAVMNSPAVTLCLALHFGEKPLASFKKHLARMVLKQNISVAMVRTWELYASINGWRVQKPDFPMTDRKLRPKKHPEAEKPAFDLSEFEE